MSVLSKLFGASRTSSIGAVEARELIRAGATLVDDAINLTGGMTAWQAAGLPMVNSRGKKGALR